MINKQIQHFKLAILKEDEEQSLYQLALYGEQGIEVSKEEMLDYLLRSAKKKVIHQHL